MVDQKVARSVDLMVAPKVDRSVGTTDYLRADLMAAS